jgi:hypothetical protein
MGNPHSLAQGVRPSYAPPGLRMQNATFIPRLAPFPQAYAWGYHLAPATRAGQVHGAGHGEGMGGGAIIRRGWRGWIEMR